MAQELDNALVFTRVVEEGSFTAAARRLGLPTTTVSRRIKALEQHLGARLLNRTTRRLSLTEAGAVYYGYCRRIATELDEAEEAVRGLERSPKGWLRVSVPTTLCPELLAALVGGFRERFPEVRVNLLCAADGIDQIADRIDVALRNGPLPDSSLVAHPLARHASGVYASDAYLDRHGEPGEPADLSNHFALADPASRRGGRYVWRLHDDERQVDVPVEPMAVANDPSVLRGLLAAGHGLMLTSELLAGPEIEAGRVRRVLTGWSGPVVELLAVFPGGRLVPPKVRLFVDHVAEQLAPPRSPGRSALGSGRPPR